MPVVVARKAKDQRCRNAHGIRARRQPPVVRVRTAPGTGSLAAPRIRLSAGRIFPLFVVLCLLLGVRAAPAFAHGEAEWIMKDPTYVSAFGQHCCSPQDCERIPASVIREHGHDIHLLPTSQVFRKGAAGTYPSRDSSWWWCKQLLMPGQSHPSVRCVFFPFHGL